MARKKKAVEATKILPPMEEMSTSRNIIIYPSHELVSLLEEKMCHLKNHPKRPFSAFMHYSREVRIRLQQENPEISVSQMGRDISRGFRSLTEEEKSKYKILEKKGVEIYQQEHEVHRARKVQIEDLEKKLQTKLAKIEVIDIPPLTTKIWDYAFKYYSSIVSVEIPIGVTKIGKQAFADCSSLRLVEIPGSVVEIGEEAFKGCTSLQTLDVPNNVFKLGKGAFSTCSSLESIYLPNSINEIAEDLFLKCTSLKDIHIPSSVTLVGERAFNFCKSLTSVHIPNCVTKIGGYSFFGCENLVSILIPKSVKHIEGWSFDYCKSLHSIMIQPGHEDPFDEGLESLYEMDQFYDENGEYIEDIYLGNILPHRFDNLPMHDICYYDLNGITLDEFAQLLQRHADILRNTDGAHMTALHFLCCNPTARPELINALIEACPQALSAITAHGHSWGILVRGMTPYMLFLRSRGFLSLQHFTDSRQELELPSLSDLVEKGVKWRDLEIVLKCFGSQINFDDVQKNAERVLLPLMAKAASNPQCDVGVVYDLALRLVDYIGCM